MLCTEVLASLRRTVAEVQQTPDYDGVPTEAAIAEVAKPVHPYFEVQVTRPGHPEYRLPFFANRLILEGEAPLAFPGGTDLALRLEGELVYLEGSQGSDLALVPGESLEIDGSRITLIDIRRPSIAFLHGLSDSLHGKVWPLGEQQTWLGRKGKRINDVELADNAVSRTHATFIPSGLGNFDLLSETSAPTTVNGKEVGLGERITLQHGDILGFGNSLLRFCLGSGATDTQAALSLKTLGTFALEYGGKKIIWEVTNPKTRWLLALLGQAWGEPVSVEWLIGTLWPEATTLRARKSLGKSLIRIREALGVDEDNFENLFLRTTTTLCLNPKRLGFHDYIEIREACESRQPLTSVANLQRLTNLYRGDFVFDCYEDWAELERDRIKRSFLGFLLRAARQFREKDELEGVNLATSKCLDLDPGCQEATKILMEACLDAAQPTRAAGAYLTMKSQLLHDGLEPDTELLRLYYRAELGC
jgi:DNA-binding SARP family transcriptional activator